MNRRAFFGRFGAVATVAAVPSAMTIQPAPVRRAFQGGMAQCPECLCVLAIDPPRHPDALRRWLAQETHTLRCPRCNIDVIWRTLF